MKKKVGEVKSDYKLLISENKTVLESIIDFKKSEKLTILGNFE